MKRRSVDDVTCIDDTRKRSRTLVDTTSVSQSIDSLVVSCYDDLKELRLSAPSELPHTKSHLLKLMSEDYRLYGKKLNAYTDSNGVTFPLDCWMEIVPAINRQMKKCVKGRMIKTYYSNDTGQKESIPSGMHIFSPPLEITENLIRDALREAGQLYRSPGYRENKKIHIIPLNSPPACNLLFYAGCGGKQPTIKEVFHILFKETPSLAKYALIYLSVIRDILELDDEQLESINVTLVHYDPLGGINPHVDTVYLFNGTLGPIFTVSMGLHEKMLDLIPVLLPDNYKPVRIFSQPNEIMLMDGIARTLYAHSTPLNAPNEHYTLVFKCPEFRKKTHSVPFEYEGKTLSIPYHYVSPSATPAEAHD